MLRYKIALIIALLTVVNSKECTENNNIIYCPQITNVDNVNYQVKNDKMILNSTNGITGGNLNITFRQNVRELILGSGTFSISGGKVDINYTNATNGYFNINTSAINISNGGSLYSKYIMISGQSGGDANITISGSGTKDNPNFKAEYIKNAGIILLNNGTSNITSLDNQKEIIINKGINTINTLTNENGANTSINNGTNTLENIINGGSIIIAGGDNTFTNITNNTNININNGTNTLENIINGGSIIIAGGDNTFSNLVNNNSTTIISGTNIINKSFNNQKTLNLTSTLKISKDATFYNYGSINGDGTIQDGSFQHYGNLSGFNGSINTDNFINFTALNINNNSPKFSVKNFNNEGSLIIEQNLDVNSFRNSGIYSHTYLKNSTLNIKGQTQIKCEEKQDSICPCNGDSTKQCSLIASAHNGGFFYLQGGSIDSKITFNNSGILDLESGTLKITRNNSNGEKNTLENTGVIRLHGASIDSDILNSSNATFSLDSGSIKGNINNDGNFNIKGGNITGNINNNGGIINISDGSINGDLTNQILAKDITDKDGNPIGDKQYKEGCIYINGNTTITNLINGNSTQTNKYKSKITLAQGNLTISKSLLNKEQGVLESFSNINTETLTNNGVINIYSGGIKSQILDNNKGIITSYKGSSVSADTLSWGNGTIKYINGYNGELNFTTINALLDSKLNLDFSNEALVFGKEYRIIKTNSSNINNITIESNIKDNLNNKDYINFKQSIQNGYFIITAIPQNDIKNQNLDSILSPKALNELGETTNMLNSLKSINSNEILAKILSNPSQVAYNLESSNYNVARNNAKNNKIQLANTLSNLNRLNKKTTPILLSQKTKIIAPTYSFNKQKNDLIKLTKTKDSIDEEFEEYLKENFKDEIEEETKDEEKEAVELKYNQILDYDNNLYASIFGIFGKFDKKNANTYGIITGYDKKINNNIIIGGNISYGVINTSSHNLGIGGYGRVYILNSEIDFNLNFNFGFSGFKNNFLDKIQDSNIFSFGLNGNINYGYLFNIYKENYIKPFGGINLYYAITPSYKENGEYARNINTTNSTEISLELGLEYRVIIKKLYYFYIQAKIEQFILNSSNGLTMNFIGDSTKFEIAKYSGYKDYAWVIAGGDFSVIEDILNITANIGFKAAILRSKINSRAISENYAIINAGIKYLF
ncbi:autotransporter outer membrane beta-barrel domain-containing protein [Helicobacter sp. MIT 14-3879]|uniref:autotransporter outer membrane beta-barrel domain-containing protein n=1 Tax=Helicobacter sp. MIT 14-3879 TaxID=2040649 RepID=UPI000E1F8B05|nr:autotransporter outer membrane beta-barrel domain-containing protein [Helicobacter sp. MIT 14-3879]RDU65504.1 hypothetical protein CQA44_00480 [Helicobacter sp. MIT 14-3879]